MLPFFKKWLTRSQMIDQSSLKNDNIPYHIAIIMDGNGRWAKKRGMPRVAGHHSGMKNVKKIAMAASDLGVKVLTLYAFSTENWKRPKDEVEFLMNLPQEFFPLEIEELIENNVQIRMLGWIEDLPAHTLKTVKEAVSRTKQNSGMILNFALNYGSRMEIVQAVKGIAQDVVDGRLLTDNINEAVFSQYLLTRDLPDPDLMIRTSGELRISNFLLWQMAYAELWFSDSYWPEFTEQHFYQAVQQYQRRARRYGGV